MNVTADTYLEASRRYREITQQVSRHTKAKGLTPQQWLYLETVNKHPGCGPQFISTELGVTRPFITASTAILESRGFIALANSPADRRRTVINLTDKGRAAL